MFRRVFFVSSEMSDRVSERTEISHLSKTLDRKVFICYGGKSANEECSRQGFLVGKNKKELFFEQHASVRREGILSDFEE